MGFQLDWDDWWGCYEQLEPDSKEQIRPELQHIIDTAVGSIKAEMLKYAPDEYKIVEQEEELLPDGYTEYEPVLLPISDRTPEQRNGSIRSITDRLGKQFKDTFGRDFDMHWLKRGYTRPRGIWYR